MDNQNENDIRQDFIVRNQNNDFYDPGAPFGPIELNILERVENGLNYSYANESDDKNLETPQNEKDKYKGRKEIIFVTGWININAVYQRYFFALLARIAIGIVIIWSLLYNNQNFAPVAILFCLINFGHIMKNIYFLIQYRNSNVKVRSIFLIELHVSIGYFIYFLGFFLILNHIITAKYFLLYSLPYVALTVFLFFKNADDDMYLSQKKFSIFESFQLLLIAFKFSQADFIDWNYTLIFFMAAAIYLTVLGMLLTIILSCSLFGFLYRNLEPWKIKSLIWMTWYYLWTGMIYIYLVKGVIHFYGEDTFYDRIKIDDYTTYQSEKYDVLFASAVLLIFFSLANLIFHVLWKKEIKKYLTKVIYKDELRREISLRFLTKSFTFKLIQVSTTYFTKPDMQNKQIAEDPEVNKAKDIKVEEIQKKEVISELEDELCVFCYTDSPNIMIDKCGHGGVCKVCMIHYLKNNERRCPFCKRGISKIYLLEQNEKDKQYYAKGEIKFKD